MSTIVRPKLAEPHPVDILREAGAAARARGLYVYPGDHGVEVVSSAGLITWGLDADRQRVVSPYGAALLHIQPQAEDFDAAVRLALGAEAAYVEAFGFGLELKVPGREWTERHLRRASGAELVEAYEHGVRFRGELIRPRSVRRRS